VSHHGIDHRHAPASCVSLHGSTPPSKTLRSRFWALIIYALAASIPSSDVVLQSSVSAQVTQLQGCLVWVGSFLERAEVALSRLSLLPAMLKASHVLCPPGEVGDGSQRIGERCYMFLCLLVLRTVRCCCPPCHVSHLSPRMGPLTWLMRFKPGNAHA
jgi:hypothetical protein